MRKRITVYFRPLETEIELPDNLEEYDIEQELNAIVYGKKMDEITDQAEIDYFEEA